MFKVKAVAIALVAAMVLLVNTSHAGESKKDVPQYLQDISVLINAQNASGSGVFKKTKDGQTWVWTCGHLVEHLRKTRKGSDGKPVTEFDDAEVVRIVTEKGRRCGEFKLFAEVIRYSHATNGDDLALLRLRSTEYKPKDSAIFWLDKELPPLASPLYHCGSRLGDVGANSITGGILSQHGRILFGNKIFDQTDCNVSPGSSGGIICLQSDGRYIGMLVRGFANEGGFNFIVPVRRMQEWAKKVGVEFAMDDNIPVPSEEKLKSLPIDDAEMKTKDAKDPIVDE